MARRKRHINLKCNSITAQLSVARIIPELHAFGKTSVYYIKKLLSLFRLFGFASNVIYRNNNGNVNILGKITS